jgi:thioredoxin 1
MSDSIIAVDESNYANEVEQSTIPVVIDFWAPWCGPCIALMPTIEAVAKLYDGKVKVVKVNVDENKEISAKFGVRGIPYLAVVEQGKVTCQLKQHTRTRLAMEFDKIVQGAA